MNSKIDSNHASVVKRKAWGLFQQGQINQASKIAIKLYDSGYIDAELAYLVGGCQVRLGNITEAIKYFEESLALKHDFVYVHIALGAAYSALGKQEKAIDCYKEALAVNPSQIEAYLSLGDIKVANGEIHEAEKYFLIAAEFNPKAGIAFHKLGELAKQKNDIDKIIKYFTKAHECNPNVIEFQVSLGEALVNTESYAKANEIYAKTLAQAPLNIPALGGKSISCVRHGDYAQAIECIDVAVNADLLITNVAIAYLSVCKHVDRCDEAIVYGKRCLEKDKLADHAKVNIYASLAMSLDSRGSYDDAWLHLDKSKKLNSRVTSYDSVEHKIFINDLIGTFSAASLFGLPVSDTVNNVKPIFIIGMPRSGTSLVEQILASHPDVSGGGELPYIGDAITRLPSLVGTGKQWPKCITDVSQENINILSDEYISKLSSISQTSKYITDKMPHNYYALGLIQLLFPGAKIIHCRRQPLDTCLSIYFQNFLVGHEYSDNLFNLGTHYYQYLHLMDHWKGHLKVDMLEIDYEELVNKPEDLIRNLLEFCEIPWDDNCLQFNKYKRRVNTASFDQVRQPIHTKSIDRWRNYEKYLDDLKLGLERGF